MTELTVWKYEAPWGLAKTFTIDMPAGAKILTVQVQPIGRGVMLWALVDPSAPKRQRIFHITGTGYPIDQAVGDLEFIGTVQFGGGALVFHLFEVLGTHRPYASLGAKESASGT